MSKIILKILKIRKNSKKKNRKKNILKFQQNSKKLKKNILKNSKKKKKKKKSRLHLLNTPSLSLQRGKGHLLTMVRFQFWGFREIWSISSGPEY